MNQKKKTINLPEELFQDLENAYDMWNDGPYYHAEGDCCCNVCCNLSEAIEAILELNED